MKKLIVLDKEELRLILNDLITQLIENKTAKSKKEFLTKQELIKLTGWSSRTLQHLRDTCQIPYSQHGRKILYPYSGIIKFLEKNMVIPKESEVKI